MADENNRDHLLLDPLSSETRRERKHLLTLSVISVAVAKTGLLPTKISALGIEFERANQKALLILITIIILYYLIAFFIYGISDFLAWRRALHKILVSELTEFPAQQTFGSNAEKMLHKTTLEMVSTYEKEHAVLLFRVPKYFSWVRAFFEFIFPIIVGITSTVLLVSRINTI